MKRATITGIVAVVLGMLIALGPRVLFKICAHREGAFPLCYWTAQAEIGVGLLIAALGLCMLVFTDPKTHLGLGIGIFFAGFIALFLPHSLIGGCAAEDMACRQVAFPALTVESIVLMAYSAVVVAYGEIKKPVAKNG
ncbi:MAG: DUF4418 family protein [Treponema sp.]|nr:DUF4418 family protein [Treponema sp.]